MNKSFVKIKYGKVEDKKEAKITRLNSVSLEDENYSNLSVVSEPFVRGGNTSHKLYENIYKYYLLDQYKDYITKSEYGRAVPMIKETFGKFLSPYPSIRESWKRAKTTSEWSPKDSKKYYFHDLVRMNFVYEDDFRPPKSREFYHTIRNNRLVFELRNHVWHGSVNEKHVTDMTDNNWKSVFVNVKEDDIGWWLFKHKEVISFQIKTTYTVKTN